MTRQVEGKCPHRRAPSWKRTRISTCIFTILSYVFFSTVTTVIADEFDDSSRSSALNILLKLHSATRGRRWRDDSEWKDNPNPCEWFGITCYDEDESDERRIGHIKEIHLSDNKLVGTLPPEVYQLPYIYSIILEENPDLSINFESIEDAQYLEKLVLGNTMIESFDGVEKAMVLSELHITNCHIGGPIPQQIYSIRSLKGLYANFNDFTGELSTRIGRLLDLQELYLYDNNLEGQIPTEMGRLTSLKVCALSQNAFGGTLPLELNNMKNLAILAIQREKGKEKGRGIRGPLPSLRGLKRITEVYLENQLLDGKIPNSFLASAPNDSSIKVDLSGNKLEGAVPVELDKINRLRIYLADNFITHVPSKLCDKGNSEWMGGDVGSFECDGLLCPPGSFSPTEGRRASDGDVCQDCASAKFWGSTSCSTSAGSALDQRKILISFFNDMGGRYWRNAQDWVNPSIDVCEWFGIECNDDSQVTVVDLNNNDLTGSPPERFFSLLALEEINFASNDITVNFSDIAKAKSLSSLNLASTGITSFDKIGQLAFTPLRGLNLASNALEGPLPIELFSIKSLKEVDLSHNKIDGLLPSEVAEWDGLEGLYLYGNRLTGQLPTQIGLLVNLQDLVLSENDFTGTLPTELNKLVSLKKLSIHQTSNTKGGIRGPLPSFKQLSQLTTIHLDANQLSGTLPSDLLANTEMKRKDVKIRLSDNLLKGRVPGEWADRFNKLFIDLAGNQITAIDDVLCEMNNWMGGAVGDWGCSAILCPKGLYNEYGRRTDEDNRCRKCHANADSVEFMGSRFCSVKDDSTELATLQKLYFGTGGPNWIENTGWVTSHDYCNDWKGIRCDTEGQVVSIDLSKNRLSGQLPTQIFTLPALRELYLAENFVAVSFHGIEEAGNLEVLHLADIGLPFIDGIGQAKSLRTLHLTSNDLAGTMPDELFELTNLEYLHANNNKFSGRLPSLIGQLDKLKELHLMKNRLEGQIPAAIGSLTELQILSMSENNFKGTLPEEFNNLISLRVLSLQREGGADDGTEGDESVGTVPGTSSQTGTGIGGPLLSFNKLTELTELYLGSNSLVGTIPFDFLDGINSKAQEIKADLASNQLTGEVPGSLTQFEKLSLYVVGNKFTSIAPGICLKADWLEGDIYDFDCDGLLCPPGKYGKYGRASKDGNCMDCPTGTSATFYGSFVCSSGDDEQAQVERSILEKLYDETGGSNWRLNANWKDSSSSICSWYGVTCVSAGIQSVEALHLSENALGGTVPSEIFQLPHLAEIDFGGNDILVPFVGIENAYVETLNIDNTGTTSLEGIQKAPRLEEIHAEGNDFRGIFPFQVFLIEQLKGLTLSDNEFTGIFPAGFKALTNLVYLACNNCRFNGKLPTLIGDLTTLVALELNQNTLSGGIPTQLMSLSLLHHLDLSSQVGGKQAGLSGHLVDFSGMPKVSALLLSENKFTGAIPPTLLQDYSGDGLVTLDLRDNLLTGGIPTEFGPRFPDLNIYLSDNKITGIPDSLCSAHWNDGNVLEYGCDGILCGKGEYNPLGRATKVAKCKNCSAAATFFGSTDCGDDSDKIILEELYDVLGGINWDSSTGWKSGADKCDWFGIRCYGEEDEEKKGHVMSIDLQENKLIGTVSSIIFNLPFVNSIRFKKDPIDLDFSSIKNAKYLETLFLSETSVVSLTGIDRAPNLKALHLTSNNMGGQIPTEIFLLTTLESLFLNYNELTGTLSTKIGGLTKLKNLFLFHNQIRGTIPTEIGLLTDLEIMALGENFFSGRMPTQISNLSNLQIIALQREDGNVAPGVDGPLRTKTSSEEGKGLSGPLPSLENLPKIREVYLGSNSFQGTIPASFMKSVDDSTALIKVDLTLNELRGRIPSSLSRLQHMRLYLAGNQIDEVPSDICDNGEWMDGAVADGCDALLCPPRTFNVFGRRVGKQNLCDPCANPVSTEFYGSIACDLDNLQGFSEREILRLLYEETGGEGWNDKENWLEDKISICDWHGILCASEGVDGGEPAVTRISLSSNALTGTIPPVVFQLPSLKTLNLKNNPVFFSFVGIEAATSLEELYIDDTRIGSLVGVQNAKGLKMLSVQDNNFGGSDLPQGLLGLTNLQHLYMSNSNFGGPLPEDIGRLGDLREFYCHENDLTGELPTSLGRLSMIEILDLSENIFYGNLPTELNLLTNLKSLFLDAFTRDNVGLSGPLLDFAELPNLRQLYLGSNSLTGTVPPDLLEGVSNYDDAITVGLSSNQLNGPLPKDLSRFRRLNIDVSGNLIERIDDELCQMKEWMNGAVDEFDCNAILCPIGTFNEDGRQSSRQTPCLQCNGMDVSEYMGNRYCRSEEKKREKLILVELYNSCGGPEWKRSENWLSDTVDICNWHGIECRDGRSIESIALGANNLVGTPPSTIFEIVDLKRLWLYSNPVDFKFDGIHKAKKLQSLLLDSTGLESLNGIGGGTSLVDFSARFNSLQGMLTSEISQLRNLETISLTNNEMSGPLPPFSGNPKLKNLRVGSNRFTGTIPDFKYHADLVTIDLSGNRLTGTIPINLLFLVDISNEIYIDFSSNNIIGIVPPELQRFDTMTLFLRDNKIEGIDPSLCGKGLWNGGDVGVHKCDGIMCPPKQYSPGKGRASKDLSFCQSCEANEYYGASVCSIASYLRSTSALSLFPAIGIALSLAF